MCYFPLPTPKSELIRAADYMIGNEVVFDNVDGLQRGDAIAGAARDARAFHSFPKFTGAIRISR